MTRGLAGYRVADSPLTMFGSRLARRETRSMTDEGRKKQIETALAARLQKTSAEQHSHPLVWRGSERYFPVIELPLDAAVLNAESHRIRAELEAPEFDFVRKEPTSERAQQTLAELWKTAHRKFDKLKEDLAVKGQEEPGVITRAGVLINGNTRLVALRELQDADRQFIRVAVVDADATPFELAQMELRLQVRDPLRDAYKLSNELLFIEELAREWGMTGEQIAVALAWNPTRPAIGKKKVDQHRRILQLIREMQRRDPHLPITFFDDKLQHMKELEVKYGDLVAAGETERAGVLLNGWLVIGRSGFSSVHKIRPLLQHEDFIGEYVMPHLGQQELIGEQAEALVRGKQAANADLPGIGDLDAGGERAVLYDLKPLLKLVESKDGKRVTLPGRDGQIEAEQVKAAIHAAVDLAIKEFENEDKAEDALNAPVTALHKAGAELKRASGTYSELRGTKEFERQARAAFEYELKKLRKQMKVLEDLVAGKELAKAGR